MLDYNRIYVDELGSEVKLNEKIRDEEMHEYFIEDRKELIDNLIGWISECDHTPRGQSNKALMQEDLEMLMGRSEDFLFSSNSTNDYIFEGDSNFDETCEKLIELNKSLD